MSAISTQLEHPSFAAGSHTEQLRTACNEFIGMVMFTQMLQQARESKLNSDLFSSSGQRMFQGQLDSVLIQKAAASSQGGGMFGPLGDALYRSLDPAAKPVIPSRLNVKG